VAAMTEPVTSSSTSQHTATPAAAAHRIRLRLGSGTRAGRPRSVIEHRP
jgi:hypothetical protein